MLLCLLLWSSVSTGQELAEQIPLPIKSALDRKFQGWKFVEASNDIRKFLREHISAEARPEIIRGDFDGNGQLDYAVLIAHSRVLKDGFKAGDEHIFIAAFLKKRDRYKLYVLDEAGEYLTLGRKGANGYDFYANKKFEYANDAIQVWIFEKAGWSYVYEKGKFRYIYMVD